MVRPIQVPTKRIEQERIQREAELYAGSFRAFIRGAWDIVEPGSPFMDGYHIDAIGEHLEACARGQIEKLLINIAPRHGKSTLVSVLFPAWMWTHTPTERMLFGSYALDLARSDSTRTRRVVTTEWYQQRWPFIELSEDQATKSNFENTLTGRRQITSVGGPTTGLGGTTLVLDDPLNMTDAESEVVRQSTITWIREAFSTRKNPGRPIQICVMQRLHQGDPSGYFISEGGWEHLILPVEYEGARYFTGIGWTDPRTEPGEILWKERYGTENGKKELEALKRTLGSVGVAGQLQQRPVPRGGGTFKREWLCFWYDPEICAGAPEPVLYPKNDNTYHECPQKPLFRYDESSVIDSWDLAFKGGEKNDFVVGQKWVRGVKEDRANHYLIDQIRGNFDFVETVAAVRRLHSRKTPTATLVEEKANGAAVIASLKSELSAIIAVNPEGGKESRAAGVAPMFEAGNIWLPHPKMPGCEWVQGYIDELTMFPRGNHDDQVDATTQALIRLKERHVDDIDLAPTIMGHSMPSRWRV
jgi:predicted phage terminase large subunit-like protein